MGFSGRSFILRSSRSFHLESTLPHIRKSKTVLDSGFHTVRWGVDASDMKPDIYTVLDTVFKWN